ncbi:universal stress protein [Salinispora arenicola]|uniref:universal stress protein n=1 Tax=Salinispora arenicola TaxID=168697 RepID=UPI0003A71568|nr:universal stress protein [Salinispora arenicola]
MTAASDAPVLVGVGSEQDLPLVRLAAQEAAAFGRPLRLMHSFDWGEAFKAPSIAGPHDAAQDLLDRAVELAGKVDESLPVRDEIAEGSTVETLIRRSEAAFLVAVGDSGMSTRQPGCANPAETPAVQVAARAGCPVLVARRDPPPEGPVLVGVDGSTGSRQALRWAFDCAVRRAGRLVALRVVDRGHDENPEILAEIVASVADRQPAVPVECHTIRGTPGDVLVEQSRSAQVVVLAARGHQPGRGMIGSAVQSVLYHSPTPVIVVRGITPADSP